MSSKFRVPRTRLTGLFGAVVSWYAKRTYGEVPDNVHLLWHNKPVLRAVLGFEHRIAGFKALDPQLRSYAEMASAGVIGCSWCLDFGYFLAHQNGLDERKVREVPRWRDSTLFTDLERDVMAYAEAMTATPPEGTDEMVEQLRARLDD